MTIARRQREAVRQLLRGAALSGAQPNTNEIDELRRLRLPVSAVALTQRYAAAIAEEGANPNTSRSALRRTADLLAADLAPASN